MQSNASKKSNASDEQLLVLMYIFATIHGKMHILVNATIIRNASFKKGFSKTKTKLTQKKDFPASEHPKNPEEFINLL